MGDVWQPPRTSAQSPTTSPVAPSHELVSVYTYDMYFVCVCVCVCVQLAT